MEHQAYVDGVRSEIERMAGLVAGQDLSARVPSCPDWDLAELIRHAGRVHRWVTAMIATRAQEYLDPRAVDMGFPEDPAALPGWLGAGAGPLLAQLSGDPALSIWSFGPGKCLGWWARRQLQETTVHRADAELTLGQEPAIAAEVAGDGIAELLGDLLPYTGAAKRVADLGRAGDSLHLHATDGPGEWTITLTDAGFGWDVGHGKATVAVRGSAADLLLLMWNRRRAADVERFETFGELGLLDAWLGAAAI